MSAHTEAKIHQLCSAVLAAEAEAEVERIISQLRDALQEHVRLAKASLQDQAVAIAALNTSNAAEVDSKSKVVSE